MTEREIHERITAAYEAETPDLLSRIEASCRDTDVEGDVKPEVARRARVVSVGGILQRAAAIAACFIFLISGILIGRIPTPTVEGSTAAYIYLDVNPSIQLAVDENDKVTSCTPSNEDAEAVLTDLSLVGVDMNTALSAIVGSMYVNGYLTENNNSILISVESESEDVADSLIARTTERVNAVFEKSAMSCSIIAQSVISTDELKARAKENGVSVGKMHLVDKMANVLDNPDEIDINELVDMTIGELNLMYSTAHKNNDGGDGGIDSGEAPRFDKDVVSGSLNGYKTSEDAKAAALSHLSLTEADVKSIVARAIVKRDGEGRVMVYSVWVVPNDYSAVHELTIDCVSGEVLSSTSHTIGLGDIFEGLGDIRIPGLDIDIDRDDGHKDEPDDEHGMMGGEQDDDKHGAPDNEQGEHGIEGSEDGEQGTHDAPSHENGEHGGWNEPEQPEEGEHTEPRH